MSNQQPPAQTTGAAILSTAQAVKSDTEQILDLLSEDEKEGEDRIDQILIALATLLVETSAIRAELAELRGAAPSASS